MQSRPVIAGDAAARAIDARTAFVMDDMLRGVATSGTTARAATLKRSDVAGQDRHHQRIGRRLVLGLYAQPGGHRVAGLRPAQIAGLARDRRRRNHADLARLHEGCAQGVPEEEKQQPRPDGLLVENGELYFSEFPPGQAVARLEPPRPATLGDFLNGLTGGNDNSIRVAPGVGTQRVATLEPEHPVLTRWRRAGTQASRPGLH